MDYFMINKYVPVLSILLFSLNLQALETGWVELIKGSIDKNTGSAIRDIIKPDKEGKTTVIVAIPKTAIQDVQNEEIVVYGKSLDKTDGNSMINVSYEWLTNYEQDYYGLLIKFGKSPMLPVRFYLKSTETNKINP
jgi:hypothetical protein